MLFFKRIRLLLRKTQQEMAGLCGISRSAWQMVEYGVFLPSAELAQRICELTGLPAVPAKADCLSMEDSRRLRRGRPFEFRVASEEVWSRTHEHCQSMTGLYAAIDPGLVAWMESLLEVESVREGFTWLQLAYAGARQFVANPHLLGFRGQPLVDRAGQALGERLLPGLKGRLGSMDYLVWPQVSIRPRNAIFRLDGLMMLAQGPQRHWCDLEVDSDFHVADRDELRRKLLALDEIRLTQEDVDRFKVVERITSQAGKFLPQGGLKKIFHKRGNKLSVVATSPCCARGVGLLRAKGTPDLERN